MTGRGKTEAAGNPAPSSESGVIQRVVGSVARLLFDSSTFPVFLALLLVAETVLGALIIKFVAYTEIDWIAYMQVCSGRSLA